MNPFKMLFSSFRQRLKQINHSNSRWPIEAYKVEWTVPTECRVIGYINKLYE